MALYQLIQWWSRVHLNARNDAQALKPAQEVFRNIMQRARLSLEQVDEIVANAAGQAGGAKENGLGNFRQQHGEACCV